MEHAALRTVRSRPRWQELLARVGLVAKGVSFGLVGALAVGVALGVGGDTTSRQGALHDLAGTGFGSFVLVLLVIGFVAYAAWRVMQAFTAHEDDAKKLWAKRAAYAGRAIIYLSLAFSAAKILAGAGGGQSQDAKAHKTTAVLLSLPGGRWIVGIGALVVIGVGFWNLYRGLSRKFEDKWVDRSDAAQRWGGYAGVVGHAARFVVFGLIGAFALKAAVDYSPSSAIGLDGALRKLAHQSYGPVLLGVTAAGLVAYAVYCFVDARYRNVSA